MQDPLTWWCELVVVGAGLTIWYLFRHARPL